ncbi:hypothetical protein BAUCODRAFT_386635 [Baudoinia panamericana UAMH 10762]|uniref:Uncharacterized protein n=1 Tax=Baudoinia panamericana (strain UAMH 10762) TaxID=717646 RepID=M2LWE4_BAUPA|nr:uncharacterized protein BAUCODRAFT_386635 [Baudoinia panamericana UAMH 10762]EMC98982.1 hypothetical protein BAUCODRAFT_386635 [Baudoinia panamericana UAMH 10762]
MAACQYISDQQHSTALYGNLTVCNSKNFQASNGAAGQHIGGRQLRQYVFVCTTFVRSEPRRTRPRHGSIRSYLFFHFLLHTFVLLPLKLNATVLLEMSPF